MSHPTNRRRFIQTTAGSSIGFFAAGGLSAQDSQVLNKVPVAAPASGAMTESRGVATKFWIDPRMADWPPGPMRKVHIEYHTSRYMPRLAERFNPDEFGDRLLAAHVTGATVFAKDMYGIKAPTAWPSAPHWLITPATKPSSPTRSITATIIFQR